MVTRTQLEHAIRASTRILGASPVIVIGSQSILASWDERDLPVEATMSIEIDVVPLDDDENESLATALDGAIGEFSEFHRTHDFYVQGVGKDTAHLPPGWADRLIEVSTDQTGQGAGLCLEQYDLCAAKLLANREKDRVFVGALIAARMIDPNLVHDRIVVTETDDERVQAATAFLRPHCQLWWATNDAARTPRPYGSR